MKGIKIGSEGFDVSGGGFKTGDTDAQCLEVMVRMTAGHAGQAPMLGVNILKYANAPRSHAVLNGLKKRIKLNLKKDGATAGVVNVNSFPNLQINAHYDR